VKTKSNLLTANKKQANKACTGRRGFCGTYGKQFSGVEFISAPKQNPRHPSAMLRERKPLGAPTYNV
jgi:hypothetical protein